MSTPCSPVVASADFPASQGSRRQRESTWPAWTREPLVHFLVLGALLFALDHVLIERAGDPKTIVVGADAVTESRDTFKASRGREPDEQELKALGRIWLDNEILYREGLAMQLDKGDTTIRERIVFKALTAIEANLTRPPLDDKTLREWFEGRRAKYDEPARFDFLEAALSEDGSEVATRAFVKALNAGVQGDAKAGLRVFTGRPYPGVVQSYGAEFAKALEDAPAGEWRAMQTREGWRAIQLKRVTPARAADFEKLRSVVTQDWTDAIMAEKRTEAVRELARKYRIRYEGGMPQ